MERLLIAAAVTLVIAVPQMGHGLGVRTAHAQPPPCEAGQIWPVTVPAYDHSRVETQTVEGYKVNVLVPPGYHDPDNTRRYPVLYLLHGGGWGVDSGPEIYLAYTKVQDLADDVIVVMPGVSPLGFYMDWKQGTQRWESYHNGSVIPYVDGHYRTIPDRAHRAVAGESMGGYGAMHYAARHPDLFVAAASFSGIVDITLESPSEELFWYAVATGANQGCSGDMGQGPWGDPGSNDIQWRNHNPRDLVPNLGGTSLYVVSGNGVPCDLEDAQQFPAIYPAGEPVAYREAVSFDSALTAAGISHSTEFGCGVHSFKYFGRSLEHFWPQMLAAFGTPPPESFDYRRADPEFSIWDWRFTADQHRSAEFLNVADASCVASV